MRRGRLQRDTLHQMESRVWPHALATWRPLGPAGQAAHHAAPANKRWRQPHSGLTGQQAACTHSCPTLYSVQMGQPPVFPQLSGAALYSVQTGQPPVFPHPSGALQGALHSTLQCADGPASPVPPPTSQELSRVPWCPPDRGNRLGTAGTRVRTLSRLKPKLHALGTHPRGDPDPGLEEKAGVGPVSATATPAPSLGAPPSKRRRRGVGGAPQSSWFIDQRQPSIC